MDKRVYKRESVLPTKGYLSPNKQKHLLKTVPGVVFPKVKNEDWTQLKPCHAVNRHRIKQC